MIFYHGSERWRMPLRFSSYFAPDSDVKSYALDFEPVMVNIQQMDDDSLETGVIVGTALKTLKHSLGNLRPYLVPIFREVSALPMDEKNRTFLKMLLEYIIVGCKDIEERDVEKVFRSIESREAREAYMTLAEQLLQRGKREGVLEGKREGILEGKREGMLEGKLRDKQEVLLQLLARKFGSVGEADRMKITESRDLDKLDRAIQGILSADTVTEILSALE